jgi:hypothetical protein
MPANSQKMSRPFKELNVRTLCMLVLCLPVDAGSSLQDSISDELKDDVKSVVREYEKYSDKVRELADLKSIKEAEIEPLIRRQKEKAEELTASLKKLLEQKELNGHAALRERIAALLELRKTHAGMKWRLSGGEYKMAAYTHRLMMRHLQATDEIARSIRAYLKAPDQAVLDCQLCQDGKMKCAGCDGSGQCAANYNETNRNDRCQGGKFSNFDLLCAVCNGSGICGYCFGSGSAACPLFVRFGALHK